MSGDCHLPFSPTINMGTARKCHVRTKSGSQPPIRQNPSKSGCAQIRQNPNPAKSGKIRQNPAKSVKIRQNPSKSGKIHLGCTLPRPIDNSTYTPTRNSPERVRDAIRTFPEKRGKPPRFGNPLAYIGGTPRGSCNRTLLRMVLRRFSNSRCFLEGFLEGAL